MTPTAAPKRASPARTAAASRAAPKDATAAPRPAVARRLEPTPPAAPRAAAPAPAPEAAPSSTPIPGERAGEGASAPPAALGNPTGDFLRGVYEVGRKEVLQNVRTKRLLIIGLVVTFLLAMVTLVFGPAITRDMPASGPVSKEHTVLLFYFAVGLIGGLQFTQLLAIVLTGDAVCSEWANRTIFLLLSKPVSRTAFVLGKFLGAALTVTVSLAVLFSLAYLVMQPFYEGSPSDDEVAGFFGMLGIVLLGALAFSAFALFLSTLTRSTTMSVILALSAWLIVFPLLGNVGFFIELGQEDRDLTGTSVDAWRYLNPAADMQAGARLLAPQETDIDEVLLALNIFQTSPEEVSWAIVALLGHTVLWVALALLVVQRRDFD